MINRTIAFIEGGIGNPRCVACPPGFKPVWKSINNSTKIDNYSYVENCIQITNCDTPNSLTFN